MATGSEENLSCPVCYEIFRDPVLLACSHSFCRACWQRCWRGNPTPCPLCKTAASSSNPPQNLALRNLCEVFSKEKTEKPSEDAEALCSLHYEKLRLFCLDHQQPACVVCLHSETHKDHKFSPIDEAVKHHKDALQELLNPLEKKLRRFTELKRNVDQTAKDIEGQAIDTEKQIKDEIFLLQRFLHKEEQDRMTALRTEKEQKTQMMNNQSEALDRRILAISEMIGATEEVLRAGDLSFLQRYKDAVESVKDFQISDPQSTADPLIDKDKHLKNLPFDILDNMKMEVANNREREMLILQAYDPHRLTLEETRESSCDDIYETWLPVDITTSGTDSKWLSSTANNQQSLQHFEGISGQNPPPIPERKSLKPVPPPKPKDRGPRRLFPILWKNTK